MWDDSPKFLESNEGRLGRFLDCHSPSLENLHQLARNCAPSSPHRPSQFAALATRRMGEFLTKLG